MLHQFFLIFLLVPAALFAQSKVDSLKALAHASAAKNEGERTATLEAHVGYQYMLDGMPDSAIRYFRKTLSRKSPSFNQALISSTYNNLANVYEDVGLPDSAIRYYDMAIRVYDGMRDTVMVTALESNLAILFKNRGLYDKALEYAFKAAAKQERWNEMQTLSSSFNTVALSYLGMNDLEQALGYAYRALAIRKKIDYKRGIGQSYNNLGEIYSQSGNYDSALTNFMAALRIKRENGERRSESSTLHNIGVVYHKTGKVREAEDFMRQSLTIKQEMNDPQGSGMVMNSLAEIALERNELVTAANYLTQAETILRGTQGLAELRDNLALQKDLYTRQRNYAKALAVSDELMMLKDSLLNRDKAEVISNMRFTYETQKKEQQIALLEEQDLLKTAQLAQREILIYSLGGGVVLFMVIAALVYNNFRVVRKSRNHIQLLLRELHHRVKNNLQLLSSVLSLQSQQLTDTHALQAVKSSESRVNAMALIHRKLYGGNDNRAINIREYTQELVQYLLNSYGYTEEAVKVHCEVDDVQLDVDKAIPLGLLMNEVISNSLKYAFRHVQEPLLTIKFAVDERQIKLEVKDNGIGFAQDVASVDSGFGLKMVKMLSREMKGQYGFVSNGGTTFTITLPAG